MTLPCTSSSRTASTIRSGRAAATSTTGGSCDGLRALGWTVHEHPVPGAWPVAGRGGARTAWPTVLAGIPDGDRRAARRAGRLERPGGAGARGRPAAARRAGAHAARRATADMPRRTRAPCLSAAAAVVTTSAWTRHWLLDHYALRPDRVHVAEPGVDAPSVADGTAAGGRAALRRRSRPRPRDTTCCSPRWRRVARPAVEPASASAPWTATPASSTASARRHDASRIADRVRLHRAAARAADLERRTPPPTCSCCPRAPRPTAWSSPRRWPRAAGHRDRRSAACRRRWAWRRRTQARAAGAARRPHGPRRRAAALARPTPACGDACAQAAQARRDAPCRTGRRSRDPRGADAAPWSCPDGGRGMRTGPLRRTWWRGRACSAVSRSSPCSSGGSAPARSSTACARSTRGRWRGRRDHGADHGLLRLAVEPGRARARRRRAAAARPSPRTTARSSSTRRCPAASSATCTAACGTAATSATSGRACGPWPGSAAAGQVVQIVADRGAAARAALAGARLHAGRALVALVAASLAVARPGLGRAR